MLRQLYSVLYNFLRTHEKREGDMGTSTYRRLIYRWRNVVAIRRNDESQFSRHFALHN